MPQVAAFVASAAASAVSSAGGSIAVSQAVGAAVYAGTTVAISAGASALSQALMGQPPSAESGKTSLKQTIPARVRGYGRRRIGGPYMLWAAKANYAYDVVALHHGRIEAIEQVWINDVPVNRTGGGWVIGGGEAGGGNNDLIHVDVRLGAATETAYSAIVTALGGAGVWTASHRGDGIASLGADYHHAKKENLAKDFPFGDPKWSVTARLSPIWDPRDDTVSAKANAALVIMDFLTHPEGMNEDYETTVAPALAHWMGEADICDEAIPQRAGGTAPRYEASGFYGLTEDPQDTLTKMLAACDGRLVRDAAGVWMLWVGKYRAPTVFLTADDIADYSVSGDDPEYEVINELIPSYVSEPHKWSLVATDAWRSDSDVELRGAVEPKPFALDWVSGPGGNSQARRLAKREMSRQRAALRGRIDGKLSCVRVLGQRWIGIDLSDLDLPEAVIELEKGGRTSFSGGRVELPFVLADPNADAWNAATEEGLGPQVGEAVAPEALEAPEITAVEHFFDGGLARLRVTAMAVLRDDLTWSLRWRTASASSWVEAIVSDVDPGAPVVLESGAVPTDIEIEVQVAFLTGGGSLSPWSGAADIVTSSAAEAPGYPTEFAVTGGVGSASLNCRAPTSANLGTLRYYRGSSTVFSAATALGSPVSPALGSTVPATDTVAAGVWHYWVQAFSTTGVPSGPVGPITVTVT